MNKLFSGIYSGRRVLLTGHTGFKGSWLSLWLYEMGAEVLGYSQLAPTSPNHFEFLNLKMSEVIDDVCNYASVIAVVQDFQPEIVFHLAAKPLVRASYLDPHSTFETNVMGTINLLEAIRRTPSVKAGIFITTDKCYEPKKKIHGYCEEDRLGGSSPYGVSKACAELAIASYSESFFNKGHTLIASCRAGNVIGGGDWAEDRLIPDLIRSANNGNNDFTEIRFPQAIRPWQHVLEPLSGYLLLGKYLFEGKREFANSWNFGPYESCNISVKEVVTLAQKNWDKINAEYGINEGPAEDIVLTLNSAKAIKHLKWLPVWDTMTETVGKTIDWYKNFYENKNILSHKHLSEFVVEAQNKNLDWVGK